MQYGSPGAGSGGHVCTILLEGAMGTKITHVPYRGAGPAMQDLIGGRIDFMAEQISTALPQIQGGKLKALATFGLDRAPGLEELPTSDEQGLKGIDCGTWGSFSFPKSTPDAIVQRLAQVVQRGAGVAARARPLQAARRRDPGAGAAHDRLFPQIRAVRGRTLGGPDQGERRADRLTPTRQGGMDQCGNVRWIALALRALAYALA